MRHLAWLGLATIFWGCGASQTKDQTDGARGGTAGTTTTADTAAGTTGGGTAGATTTADTAAGTTGGGTAGVAGTTSGVAGDPTLPTDIATELTGPWDNTPAGADRASQASQLSALATLTTEGLIARSTGAMNAALNYAPAEAKWLELIQGSALALNESELATYRAKGFVISNRQSYPDFFYGYKTIYAADLPIYVTADSVLNALHRSYDDILADVERSYLADTLNQLLAGIRGQIAAASISDVAKHDLGLLLGVAAGLLSTSATGLDAEMRLFIDKAKAASGMETLSLFGRDRKVDFSQFLPRGHYASDLKLEAYFRAMMWLGRMELRLTDVKDDGTRVLVRREVEDVLALQELITEAQLAQWRSIEQIVALFVGEADYMMLPQAAQLRDALGIPNSVGLAAITDENLLATIDAGSYGVQRICSQLMLVPDQVTTLPNSFAFLGQRYTVDSHVFSKVVYPNTPLPQRRMMPNPLDVAFAALGNDQAAPLLRTELDLYGYAPNLGQVRQLVEWHDASYWESSIYTLWVSALRQLSLGKYDATPLPAIARTEAWGRRLLNSQLGSWAELRHDTVLYAKQSYTGIPLCEYPDGYVDPYPGLFARLRQLGTVAAEKLSAVLPKSSLTGKFNKVTGEVINPVIYFQNFAQVAARLELLATEELTGAPRTAADLAFLNDAVAIKSADVVCTFIDYPSGWYAKLFYDPFAALEADPTIADVHTQPSDDLGNIVGKVLHVATGNPRLMVVSVDSCEGPRAYAGVVSAYFEQTTDNFLRKTDEQWSTEIAKATPADVPWMQDVVVR